MGPLLWLCLMLMILVVFLLVYYVKLFCYLPVNTKTSSGLVIVES